MRAWLCCVLLALLQCEAGPARASLRRTIVRRAPLDEDDRNDTASIDSLFEDYFPLVILLANLPSNETDCLEEYMTKKTYAELKHMIDIKKEDGEMNDLIYELEHNDTLDMSMAVVADNNPKLIDLVEAYHNASIYNAIRGAWNSQVNPILPPIDQLAILEYFAEKRHDEVIRMTFLSRVWEAIRGWWMGRKDKEGCWADTPRCIRSLVESMPFEERVVLDRAAGEDDGGTVEKLLSRQVNQSSNDVREDFEQWRNENSPPEPLLHIINNATETERVALQRLRDDDLVHALKDYYRAMIERKSLLEQEHIRTYFLRMNDTFARCYNPIRNKYEFWT